MGCKPGINAVAVKKVCENSHLLALLDGILTDGTIVIHGTWGSRGDGMLINLFCSRMNGNSLI